MFWTLPLKAPLTINMGAGQAHMSATNLAVTDYGSIPNALFRFAGSSAAHCSFDLRWSGPVTGSEPITTPAGSSGELFMNQATMTWSGSNSTGFHFVSDASPTTSAFARVGRVSNGVFFSG